ncbi:MAG TPA: hypothetical protein GX515_05000 [Firmicutes bacterium]|nr:hypothetical protein [Bacillota bacterium]
MRRGIESLYFVPHVKDHETQRLRTVAVFVGVVSVALALGVAGLASGEEPGGYGEWLKAAQQEAINSILSGTLLSSGMVPTASLLDSLWDFGIRYMQAHPDVDLSRFEAAYVLPYLRPNLTYPARVRLARYVVAKQMFQPDPEDVFKARVAALKDLGGYIPTMRMRIFLGTMDLMETGEIPLLQAYQWLTDESERLRSEGY